MKACFWVPSFGTACGISEYAGHLINELKIPVFKEQPPVGKFDIVHIQHEIGIFPDQMGLVRSINDLKNGGAKVIATEHSVGDFPRAYEVPCDGLIGLSPRGAGALKERWPRLKNIAYIAHGCPTYKLHLKKERGRTIAAFGFLEPYKGFWDIANAIRNTDINLILYSHARSKKFAEHWDEHIKGMPNVTRHDTFYPIDTVVKKLAKEADALVFWHYAPPVYSASGSIRVGMSTGIPVLGRKDSRWFQNLEGGVYLTDNLQSGIETILTNDEVRSEVSSKALEYCEKNSWKNNAELHLKLWEELLEETV